jgi:hypothetical protein
VELAAHRLRLVRGPGRTSERAAFYSSVMAEIVLRVRLIGGDRLDVTYEDPAAKDVLGLIEGATAILSEDTGVLRCKHGDRLIVIYGRGVASFEVSPRGAIL